MHRLHNLTLASCATPPTSGKQHEACRRRRLPRSWTRPLSSPPSPLSDRSFRSVSVLWQETCFLSFCCKNKTETLPSEQTDRAVPPTSPANVHLAKETPCWHASLGTKQCIWGTVHKCYNVDRQIAGLKDSSFDSKRTHYSQFITFSRHTWHPTFMKSILLKFAIIFHWSGLSDQVLAVRQANACNIAFNTLFWKAIMIFSYVLNCVVEY